MAIKLSDLIREELEGTTTRKLSDLVREEETAAMAPPTPGLLSFEKAVATPQRLGEPSRGESQTFKPEVSAVERALAPSLTEGKLTGQKLLTAPLEIAGVPARFLGAAGEKAGLKGGLQSALGIPETEPRPFLEAAADPGAGLLQPIRQKVDVATEDLPGPVKTAARLGTGVVTGALEDPSQVLTGGAGLVRKGLQSIPKKGLKTGVTEGTQGFKFSPAQAAEDDLGLSASIERVAQANPFTQKIPAKLQAENVEALQTTVERLGTGTGAGKRVDEQFLVKPRERGMAAAEKIEGFEGATKKAFEAGETQIAKEATKEIESVREVGRTALPKTPAKDIAQKNVQESLQTHFDKFKVDIESGFTGNEGIGKKAFSKAKEYKERLGNARTVSDLIRQKRNINNEVFTDSAKGLFTGADETFLRNMNGVLNEAIEKTVKEALPGEGGEKIATAISALNKQYQTAIETISPVAQKLGVKRKDFRPEDLINKVSQIGTENLGKLKELGKTDESAKAIFDELSKGAYENLVQKSLNTKSLEVSPDKFVTEWNKLKKTGIEETLFNKEMIGELDDLAKNVKKGQIAELSKFNPPGTGKTNLLLGIFMDPKQAAMALLMRPGVKYYYKTGKLPQHSVFNVIPNTAKFAEFIEKSTKGTRKLQRARVTAQEVAGQREEKKGEK